MNSHVYYILTIACAVVCSLGGLGFVPSYLTSPIVLVLSGYSLLGPRFASHTKAIELLGTYLGTSMGIAILIGIGLPRLSFAVTPRTLFFSYALLFSSAVLVWAVVDHLASRHPKEIVYRTVLSRADVAGSTAAVLLAGVAAALLLTAGPRGGTVTELAVLPRDFPDALNFEFGEAIELEAQVVLDSSVPTQAALVVATSVGQTLVIDIQSRPGAQTIPIIIPAPDGILSNLVVTAVLQDGGIDISPEVRLNFRSEDGPSD